MHRHRLPDMVCLAIACLSICDLRENVACCGLFVSILPEVLPVVVYLSAYCPEYCLLWFICQHIAQSLACCYGLVVSLQA